MFIFLLLSPLALVIWLVSFCVGYLVSSYIAYYKFERNATFQILDSIRLAPLT